MRLQLYTNNEECQNCKVLKGALDYAKIEYEYNVVSHDEIIKLANKYNYHSIPICLFDDSVVFGDANTVVKEIQRLLND